MSESVSESETAQRAVELRPAVLELRTTREPARARSVAIAISLRIDVSPALL